MTFRPDSRLIVTAGVLALMVSASARVSATSVVALTDYNRHVIVIAADAMERRTRQGSGKIEEVKICKILERPSCVAAIAGEASDTAVSFDLLELADTACRASGDLQQKADYFLRIAQPKVSKLLDFFRQTAPKDLARVTNGVPFIEAIFAGIEAGQLKVMGRGFSVINGQAASYSEDGDPRSSGSHLTALGNNAAIFDYLKRHPDWSRDADIPKLARTLVGLEIEESPADVGPPVAVLEIDQSPMRPTETVMKWIARGACTDHGNAEHQQE